MSINRFILSSLKNVDDITYLSLANKNNTFKKNMQTVIGLANFKKLTKNIQLLPQQSPKEN
jgi:transcriptional regulator NrdR family protein